VGCFKRTKTTKENPKNICIGEIRRTLLTRNNKIYFYNDQKLEIEKEVVTVNYAPIL
jgi:hypothetical protein